MAPLREDQAAAAAALLTRAFHEDPAFLYAYPHPEERERCLALHLRWSLRFGLLFGDVLGAGEALAGVAIALRPGEGDFSAGRLAQSGYYRLREELGAEGARRLDNALRPLFRAGDEALASAVPEPHWRLDFLGVEPGQRGRRIGSALLRAVSARSDATGAPVSLSTFQPRNVALYQRHGYEVVREGEEPLSGLPYWCSRRHPGG